MSNEEKTQLAQLETKISDNWERYNSLKKYVMIEGRPFEAKIGVDLENNLGIPYYRCKIVGYWYNVYITKEIRQQIYDYLKKGTIPDRMPNTRDVYKNMDESFFILHNIKIDEKNDVMQYSTETKEFAAVYPYGIIKYGQLPYTPDELVAKINSL
ncbi:MAG: hypothetical protein FWD09_07225 [Lentimicrobiaceae bacterium]|nr:hypothetical protein [Lentimicrobiaceae bacterium]